MVTVMCLKMANAKVSFAWKSPFAWETVVLLGHARWCMKRTNSALLNRRSPLLPFPVELCDDETAQTCRPVHSWEGASRQVHLPTCLRTCLLLIWGCALALHPLSCSEPATEALSLVTCKVEEQKAVLTTYWSASPRLRLGNIKDIWNMKFWPSTRKLIRTNCCRTHLASKYRWWSLPFPGETWSRGRWSSMATEFVSEYVGLGAQQDYPWSAVASDCVKSVDALS